jgi:hypothetical protein
MSFSDRESAFFLGSVCRSHGAGNDRGEVEVARNVLLASSRCSSRGLRRTKNFAWASDFLLTASGPLPRREQRSARLVAPS